jgi:deoxyribonuclease-1-like protein
LKCKVIKRILIAQILVLFLTDAYAQVRLCSWNIQNFGKSKSDSAINYMSELLRDFDVVAIVEVVAGNGGAQAVARLADALNRTGSKWDYSVSDPTFSGPGKTERYAFLWKTSKVKKMGEAWLEQKFKTEIEREPYYADFSDHGKVFTVAAFHAITKNKQPETEIKYFKFLPSLYPGKTILFCGDFNCPESHTVFNPLKGAGFKPIFTCRKTTLKNEYKGDECLASEFDNIFYDTAKVEFISSGVVEFYKSFSSLKEARRISDHLPVYVEFRVR